jgi:hypothetical protein
LAPADRAFCCAQDLQAQAELGRDRSVELAQAKELTVKLEEKHAWMLNQLDAFGSYFKARQDHKLNAKYAAVLCAKIKEKHLIR